MKLEKSIRSLEDDLTATAFETSFRTAMKDVRRARIHSAIFVI